MSEITKQLENAGLVIKAISDRATAFSPSLIPWLKTNENVSPLDCTIITAYQVDLQITRPWKVNKNTRPQSHPGPKITTPTTPTAQPTTPPQKQPGEKITIPTTTAIKPSIPPQTQPTPSTPITTPAITDRTPIKSQPKRKEIHELSAKSANRLSITTRNTEGLTHMITLTYPAKFPKSGVTVKHHLQKIRKVLARIGAGGIWFIEFQHRGAPHIHILTNRGINKKTLSTSWHRIVKSNDPKHLKAGTRIEKLRKPEAAKRYVSKYRKGNKQKTIPEGYESPGRFWGSFNIKTLIPRWKIAGPQAIIAKVLRVFKQLYKSRTGQQPKDNGLSGGTWWNFTPTLKLALEILNST